MSAGGGARGDRGARVGVRVPVTPANGSACGAVRRSRGADAGRRAVRPRAVLRRATVHVRAAGARLCAVRLFGAGRSQREARATQLATHTPGTRPARTEWHRPHHRTATGTRHARVRGGLRKRGGYVRAWRGRASIHGGRGGACVTGLRGSLWRRCVREHDRLRTGPEPHRGAHEKEPHNPVLERGSLHGHTSPSLAAHGADGRSGTRVPARNPREVQCLAPRVPMRVTSGAFIARVHMRVTRVTLEVSSIPSNVSIDATWSSPRRAPPGASCTAAESTDSSCGRTRADAHCARSRTDKRNAEREGSRRRTPRWSCWARDNTPCSHG